MSAAFGWGERTVAARGWGAGTGKWGGPL